ncbi:porin family protein [Porphyromonas sp.]|uniref:porin family protein n=1 Tax=Porphyromonas sp. TaxID=1924944 RepID=UPI0026DAC32B|nr:porin family protein [Porphyromonas sp.]MDO4771278.1 porin family protein [Porphyromonas sp.]
MMKTMIKPLMMTALLLVASVAVEAQTAERSFAKRIEYGVTAGLNVGATTPMPKPAEVDKIHTWTPHMNIALKAWGTYRFDSDRCWGITSGIEFEKKGMYASTHVSGLNVHMKKYGFEGNTYTGDNSTEVANSYLTLPVVATYVTPNEKFRVHLGFYLSYLMQKEFKVTLDGDGMLDYRELKKGALVDFDFSGQFSPVDFGGRLSFDYYFTSRIAVTGQVNLGATSVLKSSFDVMPFNLYNAYGFVGFSYMLFR